MNKLRSFLTMLGIIIGVGSVIVMVAIGTGAREKIADRIAGLGSNQIIVVPGATTAGGARMGSGTVSTLTSEDAEAILEECPAVKAAAPRTRGVGQIVFGNQNWNTGVNGAPPSFFGIRNWPAASGRLYNDLEENGTAKVAVLGRTVVENIFGRLDPVGKIIRINRIPFTVIGVLARKGQSPRGNDLDDAVYVPLSTSQKRLFGSTFPNTVRNILVQAKDLGRMAEAERQITELLRRRHRIQPGELPDFTVRNLTEILAAAEQSARVMSILLGSIALVSLAVGGIGIMNIMLVSVTERTREIGIRMAVGARGPDILSQFLIESVVLCLVGGLIGVLVGVAGARTMAGVTDWNVVLSPEAVVVSFAFAALVGIFFGFYPALKASRLNPIEALRFE